MSVPLSQPEQKARLDRPGEIQIEEYLIKFEKEILELQVKYFNTVRKGKNKVHASKSVLESDLSALDLFFDSYLQGHKIAADGLLGELLKAMLNYENKLMGQLHAPDRDLDVEKDFALIQHREYVAFWRDLAKKLIIGRCLRAVSPEHYWSKIDGDAALSLFKIQIDSINRFQSSSQLKETIDNLERIRTNDPDLAALLKRELAALISTKSRTNEWRKGMANAKTVKELGQKFPFQLEKIPSDLFYQKSGSSHPVQMHARKEAINRLRSLEMYWEAVRTDLKNRNLIKEDEFKLIVNAGSLQYGGAHPPHATHRDGTMFDIWIIGLPHFVKGKQPGLSLTQQPVDEEEAGFEEDEIGPVAPRREYQMAPSKKTEDWQFPDASEYEKVTKQKPAKGAALLWNEIAARFSQCIFLTYPSSIILASTITETALQELKDRTLELQALANEVDKELLGRIVKLLDTIDPSSWRKVDEKTAEALRNSHRHHWHLNYNPDRLGNEGRVPSGSQELANEISEVIRLTEDSVLWSALLQTPIE